MDFDFSLVMSSLPLLLQGALVTLKITALSVGLGLIFGLLAGVASLTPYWWVRIPARCYVDFIRGTPLLIQIFLIYFALPVILNTRVDPFVAAGVGLFYQFRCLCGGNLPRWYSVRGPRSD